MASTTTLTNDDAPQTVRALIVKARGTRTQREYAAILGVRQDTLSKYESGRIANPPARVIERCMLEAHISTQPEPPNATVLARRVRQELSSRDACAARAAISALLDAMKIVRSNER